MLAGGFGVGLRRRVRFGSIIGPLNRYLITTATIIMTFSKIGYHFSIALLISGGTLTLTLTLHSLCSHSVSFRGICSGRFLMLAGGFGLVTRAHIHILFLR